MARVSSQAMAIVLLIIAGRFLSVDEFGVYVLASIMIILPLTLLYTGVYHYILREPRFEQTKGSAFSLQLVFALALSVFVLLIAWLTLTMGWGRFLAILIASTTLLPILGAFGSWHEGIVLRRGKVAYYYGCLFFSEFVGFIIGVYTLYIGFGVWSLIIGKFVTAIVFPLALAFKSERMPKPAWNQDDIPEIFNYATGLYGNVILSFVSAYGATIITGAFLTTTAVAFLRMATRTAGAAFDIFSQTFRTLAWQAVGRMAREETSSATTLIGMLALYLSIVTFVLGALCILSQDAVYILLGEKWLDIVPILQIICCIKIIGTAEQLSSAQLSAAGRTRFLVKARTVEAVIITISVLIASQFGLVAVALSMIPAIVVFIVICYREMLRMLDVSVKQVILGIAPGVLGAFAALSTVYTSSVLMSESGALFRLIASSAIGAGAYLLIAAVPLRHWTQRTLKTVSTAILPAKEA